MSVASERRIGHKPRFDGLCAAQSPLRIRKSLRSGAHSVDNACLWVHANFKGISSNERSPEIGPVEVTSTDTLKVASRSNSRARFSGRRKSMLNTSAYRFSEDWLSNHIPIWNE